jgi:CRP-like cAMP-binding protein
MTENRLLQSLPADIQRRVMADTELVSVTRQQSVAMRGQSIEHVYFPTTSMVSVVVTFENGNALEAGLVGNDGHTGLSILLGAGVAHSDMYVQIPGNALRIEVGALRKHLANERLREALASYTTRSVAITGQLAGCVAFHPVDQRLARWLLMVRDCIQTDDLTLTHEFLGIMLGVQRPTVTLCLHMLERAGLIERRRGLVKIVNVPALEQAACECYGVIRALEL